MGELAGICRGNLGGLPLHVEHDTNSPAVGNVLSSYEGKNGELKVIATVDDATVAQQIRRGSLRGLSLGTDCILDLDGTTLSRSQKELSVCEEGRRDGTWITHIGNQLVHEVACASKQGKLHAPLPLLSFDIGNCLFID
jgi:hypothetical protein